ncbi:hypothetical protein CTI12_AA073670 [Artemisia annua]|uniref:Uncharacterized protein n=1 Tax=Artemisia annua TaxID=35608 RepID=A0A2U1Q5A9_ARTAN|nr:hypothetical protein CTI12_AA073670 [Artemisia annua]
MAYLLNPYYFYKDPQIQHDLNVALEFFETIFTGDLEMQKQVTVIELPKYKKKMDRFGKELAISSCKVNNDDYSSHMTQEKNGDRDGDEEVEVQPDSEAHWEAVGEAIEADEYRQPRKSSRTATKTTRRELFDEDFESGSEEVVYEEGEYQSDGVQIREDCGDEE